MTYIAKNEIFHYWKIKLVPINNKGYGTTHELAFKGKTLDGALNSANKYCKDSIKNYGFQIYGVDSVLYECDYWGRKVK